MSNLLLAYNNRADGATLAGGDWSATLTRDNLKDSDLDLYARTSNAYKSSTRFRVDLTASYPLRAMVLVNHNMSTAARLRLRLTNAPLDLILTQETMDERVTFSGGTNGTRMNADGLIENVTRTNLLLRSQEFDNAAWTRDGTSTITANAALAPDGTTTADRIVSNLLGGYAIQDYAVAAAGTYTFSVYLKAATSQTVRIHLQMIGGAGGSAIVDCAVTTVWQRFTATRVHDGTGTAMRVAITTNATDNIDAHIWGAQLELGAIATEYIPTANVAVTATKSGRIDYEITSSRTNHALYSEQISNAYYTNGGGSAITANAGVAPMGTDTADKWNGVDDVGNALNQIAAAVGQVWTRSCYVKAGTATSFQLTIHDGNLYGSIGAITVNPATGAITGTAGALVASGIEDANDGWYRAWLAVTIPVGCTAIYGNWQAGNGTLYLFGNQIEIGAVATDYIPTTSAAVTVTETECAGLLDEPARTNLATRSAELEHADWTAFNLTVAANDATAPDGSAAAEKVTSTDAFANSNLSRSVAIPDDGTTYAFSLYVKAGTLTSIRLRMAHYGGAAVTGAIECNAVTGAIVATGEVPAASGVENAGNGWWRFWIAVPNNSSGNVNTALQVYPAALDGAALGTIYCWGAQYEVGAFATSYIPTSAAAVTRPRDGFSVPVADYNAGGSTLYVERTPLVTSLNANYPVIQIDDGTTNNRMLMATNGNLGNAYGQLISGGVGGSIVSLDVPTTGVAYKEALAHSNGRLAYAKDGQVTTAAQTLSAPLTTLRTNDVAGAWNTEANCHIKRITFWPDDLTNAELELITTDGPDALGYDSGWTDVQQMTFQGDTPADWGAQYPALLAFDSITARYATVEIDDTTNAAGRVDIGRLFVGGGLQPAYGASYAGFTDTRDVLDTVVTNPNGKRFGKRRRSPRGIRFALQYTSQAEADHIHEMQAEVGTLDEVLYVPDPANAAHSQRYGFLGHLRQLSPIEYPFALKRSIAFEMREK